jgi:hypothetical protein
MGLDGGTTCSGGDVVGCVNVGGAALLFGAGGTTTAIGSSAGGLSPPRHAASEASETSAMHG